MDTTNEKTIAFLLFEKWHGRETYAIGSSRIRGHWVVKYWDEAELFSQGKEYDTILFQKAYWPGYCNKFKGIKILDICDPDWISEIAVKKTIDQVDAVTTSTQSLADYIKQLTDKPVVFIPDRQDLEFHKKKKVHKGRAERVCWFGYSHNAKTLDKVASFVKKKGVKLVVISNLRPVYPGADENIEWELDTINDNILSCDFCLLPKDERPIGKYKSNNKTTKAWALGMPVAKTPEEFERFLDPIERQKEADKRLKEVKEHWDVRLSVAEYKKLIKQLKNAKRR